MQSRFTIISHQCVLEQGDADKNHTKVSQEVPLIKIYANCLQKCLIKTQDSSMFITSNYRTWKAGLALLCQMINKSSKSGGRHLQNNYQKIGY